MDVFQLSPLKDHGEARRLRLLQAAGDAGIIGRHTQQARRQCPVGAVAFAGEGEGAVEQNVRPDGLRTQQPPGHPSDAHRAGGVGAGGADHHRAQNIE